MRFDLVTIFPEFFAGPLDYGVLRRAREMGLVEVRVQDLREFTTDRHRSVDDRPFGGGEGMVLKPEPLFECVESLLGVSAGDAAHPETAPPGTAVVLLSASGKPFRQQDARRFAALEQVVLICGRYEGVDERVAQHLATDELSIGDFVLSGGELPAALVLDAVARLLPGALGNEASAENESFSAPSELADLAPEAASPQGSAANAGYTAQPGGSSALAARHFLLDCPHYTRPADFRGWRVPEALVSGNHAEVAKWRRQAALEKTLRNRPDLLSGVREWKRDSSLRSE